MWKWVGFSLGVLVILICVPACLLRDETRDDSLGSRINTAQVTLFSTSTNANYTGVTVANVNDWDSIGFTVVGQTASGTVRFACSMQDDPITLAASSTSNVWDYVDSIDTLTETSIDGQTGLAMTGGNIIRHFVIRNSVWKWCGARMSGNTSPAGLGTTTVYMKRIQNQ